MAERRGEPAREGRADAATESASDGISHATRLWAIFPLFPAVSVGLELTGLVGNSLESPFALVFGLAVAALLSESLLRAVGPEIVDPLWYGAFALLIGALVVLATAPLVDLEPESIQRPAYAVLLACSALVVWVTTRRRLE